MNTENLDLARPQQTMQVAELLQKFVSEKKLTANIQGKNYPLVEAWQFAGSQLGLYPLCTEIQCQTNNEEIKYMAKVEVRRFSDDKLVSNGFAICSNKEYSKKKFDEYAIASMAQTRATGKAFRNLLAWLMKAAGFEATPAEEMDFKKDNDFDTPTGQELKMLRDLAFNSTLEDNARMLALESIDRCTDYLTYQKIQHRLEALQIPFDQIPNPSQKDISAHLKKKTA